MIRQLKLRNKQQKFAGAYVWNQRNCCNFSANFCRHMNGQAKDFAKANKLLLFAMLWIWLWVDHVKVPSVCFSQSSRWKKGVEFRLNLGYLRKTQNNFDKDIGKAIKTISEASWRCNHWMVATSSELIGFWNEYQNGQLLN